MKELPQSAVLPEYSGKSLLNVPPTILRIFNIEGTKPVLPEEYYNNVLGADKVVLLVVDGFGDNLYQGEAQKYDFFKKLKGKGNNHTITSVFPSTTSAALTTLNSGLSPYEHGIPEWYVYFRELEAVIIPLPYIPTDPLDAPRLANPPEGMLFNQKSIYDILDANKVPAFAFASEEIANTPYNESVFKNARTIKYWSLASFVMSIKQILEQTNGRAYFYAYWRDIDHAQHVTGAGSEEAKAEIRILAKALQEELVAKLDPKVAEKTAILLTADHGQVTVDPEKTVYIDSISDIQSYLKTTASGRIIPPSGGPRDLFLHIVDEKLEEAQKLLQEQIGDKGIVYKTQDLIEMGLFGTGTPHPEFESRVGNLLILASADNTFAYRYTKETVFDKHGHHGSLTSTEMLVPFVCAMLSDLQK